MPTYNYQCSKCKYIFSIKQSIKDAPFDICKQCKGKINRIISGGMGLIFKGEGFYETDYKQKDDNIRVDKPDSNT